MEHDISFWVGRFIGGVLIWSFLPALFFDRALRAKTRSLRLANAALGCGLLLVCLPEVAFQANSGWRMVAGMLRILVPALGAILGTLALIYRSKDQGTGVLRPILGIFFSAVHGIFAVALLFFAFITVQLPDASDPSTTPNAWVYVDSNSDLRLTLPSRRWSQVPNNSQGWTTFGHSTPHMQLSIIEVMPAENAEQYRAAVEVLRASLSRNAKDTPFTVRDAVTGKGNPYSWFQSVERTPKGEEVFAVAVIVWCKDKKIASKLIFEGVTPYLSEMAKKSERQVFEHHAEFILLSIE